VSFEIGNESKGEKSMAKMTIDECKAFLVDGARTAKLATVRKDGRPHVVPVWFDLDGDSIVFGTWHESVKAVNISHDPRVCICVDDERPPFNYVQVEGEALISTDLKEVKYWATRIAGKYMGQDKAESYGHRNSGEGSVLVRVTPTKMVGQKDIAK
jgi:PPOX class probable F420-dependent enzyme